VRLRAVGMSENVASYYWRGKGPLWKAYWLYGVLGSNVLALTLFLLIERSALGSVWFQIVLLLLAAYTVWIVVSVWRCAFNVEKLMYGHMAKALTVAWAINALLVLGFLELQLLQDVS
jgi:hypothetical protein